MADERWLRVKSLFGEALDLPPDRRAALLDGQAADDPSIAAEVRSLLEAHQTAGHFIETPAGVAAARAAGLAVAVEGRLVGPYKIIREIGRGGMGTVYLAARADGSFDRQVALKVLRPGLDTEEILQRFRHERRTLAGLDHPNIARLLDGGSTADGLPFFAMEYVEGTPIDRYCNERRLPVAGRLDLCCTLARAVQAAHRALVVHRDLKPDNVLVTPDGTVKLLDFGIAKVLTPHATRTPETRAAWRPMTPEYASPEQVLGQPITTSTDVFALGILLYELLTGRRPFGGSLGADAGSVGAGAPARPKLLEQEILEGAPPLPSAVVTDSFAAACGTTAAALRRQLAGDLDAIVAMALRKEPHRRYGAAEGMADDIRRHLASQPVLARKGAFAYRAGRFLRRHAFGAAAAAIVAVLLAAGVIGVVWQARVAGVERDRARIETEKAREVNAFLQEMLRSPDPQNQGRAVTVVDTLDRAARRLDRERGIHPEVEAGVRCALGAAYGALGLYEPAEIQLRSALSRLPTSSVADRARAAEVETELAGVLSGRGDAAAAEALYLRALAALDAAGQASTLPRADVLNGLGEVLRGRGDDAAAETRYREALAIRQRLLGDGDVLVAESLNNLAVVEHGRNNLAEAERLYRRSLEIVRAARGDEHPGVPAGLTNLATVVGTRGDLAEAERLYREALALRRRLLGDAHPDVAFTMYALADMLFSMRRYTDAAAICREVLAREGLSLPPVHPLTAATVLVLGKSLLEAGDAAGAEPALRRALSIRREVLPDGHWQTASAESALGRCLAREGRFAEAEPLVVGAYERLKADRGPAHERTVDALANVVDLYTRWHRPGKLAAYRTAASR